MTGKHNFDHINVSKRGQNKIVRLVEIGLLQNVLERFTRILRKFKREIRENELLGKYIPLLYTC